MFNPDTTITLSPDDLEDLKAKQAAVINARATYILIRQGFDKYLQGLRTKYEFPSNTNIDLETGIISKLELTSIKSEPELP